MKIPYNFFFSDAEKIADSVPPDDLLSFFGYTFSVLQYRVWLNETAFSNTPSMSVTLRVSHSQKPGRGLKFPQSRNMYQNAKLPLPLF